jgi:hypothetical protein
MIENRKGFDLFCHAVLLAGVVVIVFPVYVAFCAATMNAQEVFTIPLSLVPSTHLLENVAYIWSHGSGGTTAPFGRLLVNSFVMALGIAVGKIAVSILSAYAIVYFRFPLRNTAFWLIFVTLMLPVEVRIFPTVQVVDAAPDQHLRGAVAAADRVGDRDVPVPPVLHDAARRADGRRAHRRRGAAAVFLGRRAAAVEDEHRRAVRDHVHLRLEPVSVADPDHDGGVAVDGGGRHQDDDRERRRRDRMAIRDGGDAAGDDSAARRRAGDAALVRARPRRFRK